MLFAYVDERWDGKGRPGRSKGDELPVAVRIVQVARDAAFQRMLGGGTSPRESSTTEQGEPSTPHIVGLLSAHAGEILGPRVHGSNWDAALACEPNPRITLGGEAIDRALAAMGDFADLVSKYLVGHSRGVADLVSTAATQSGSTPRRSWRSGVPPLSPRPRSSPSLRIWQKSGELTADEWERVRLHAYQSERILSRSPALATLVHAATNHHERVGGSGYHRGSMGAALSSAARLVAAADASTAMTEPRPHRRAFDPAEAADALGREVRAAGWTRTSAAVVQASGMPAPGSTGRPASLDRRRKSWGSSPGGCRPKQVARVLGISAKTADRHIQNAYGKIGISTRAAAALFAMQHGLVAWGEGSRWPPEATAPSVILNNHLGIGGRDVERVAHQRRVDQDRAESRCCGGDRHAIRAAVVALAPVILLAAFVAHPYIGFGPPDEVAIAEAAVSSTFRWGISHLLTGVAAAPDPGVPVDPELSARGRRSAVERSWHPIRRVRRHVVRDVAGDGVRRA